MPNAQPHALLAGQIRRWKAAQDRIVRRMIVAPLPRLPRFVAGADAAISDDGRNMLAAAVVYDRVERRIVEVARAVRPVEFPYVPGYLSFREGPAVLNAIGKLRHDYGAILFDAQGYAHPRRCGLAAHLAITLDKPGVGVAKSRLIGTFEEPLRQRGSSSPLMDGDAQIGLALRTRDDVRPVFVSVGHRVDLESAVRVVLACCTRWRLPEPTRQADIEVGRMKTSG
jgi:deoxyribonuclease V